MSPTVSHATKKRQKRSKPTTADSRRTPSIIAEKPDDFSATDLLDQVSDIARRATIYLGMSSRITQELRLAAQLDEDVKDIRADDLRAALRTFSDLPSAMREAIFNGWNVATEPRPREQLVHDTIRLYTPIVRGVSMAEFAPDFEYRFWPCNFQSDVDVFVREGAQLKNVLTSLRCIEEMLRQHWARYIIDPAGKVVQK